MGAETVEGVSIPARLRSLGAVFGAEILHVGPQTFSHVKNRLAGLSPLHAVALCTGTAGYITTAAAPTSISPDLVSLFRSTKLGDIEDELIALIERTNVLLEETRKNHAVDEGAELLRVMLRGMISHSKIGPFSHCTRETVLTGVRARRLHVPVADRLLDRESEAFQDTKTSDALFLWKDHNDGRQYFLNPRRVDHIKALIAAGSG